jgi:ribulose-phosphate 3-epimerase
MSASPVVDKLHTFAPLVAPSLLACDFANLEAEIRRLEAAGARVLHLDVMDGHFVPNLSFGVPVVEAIRRVTRLPLDVHLMISDPGRYLEAFRRAGADLLTIHVEAVPEPGPLLKRIQGMGAGAGLSLNPPTPLAVVEKHLELCDLVLVMSVMPGFGGQEFNSVALEKLRRLRAVARPEVLISVDGGINPETTGLCAEAGAEMFVVGTALFSHPDYGRRMEELVRAAKSFGSIQV